MELIDIVKYFEVLYIQWYGTWWSLNKLHTLHTLQTEHISLRNTRLYHVVSFCFGKPSGIFFLQLIAFKTLASVFNKHLWPVVLLSCNFQSDFKKKNYFFFILLSLSCFLSEQSMPVSVFTYVCTHMCHSCRILPSEYMGCVPNLNCTLLAITYSEPRIRYISRYVYACLLTCKCSKYRFTMVRVFPFWIKMWASQKMIYSSKSWGLRGLRRYWPSSPISDTEMPTARGFHFGSVTIWPVGWWRLPTSPYLLKILVAWLHFLSHWLETRIRMKKYNISLTFIFGTLVPSLWLRSEHSLVQSINILRMRPKMVVSILLLWQLFFTV